MEKFKKLVVFVASAAALAAVVAVPAARGAEYEIGTLEELREFMEAVHAEDFAGDTITLTADIDCEGGRFNTGDPEYPSTFRGMFDGGGHVISNFVHAATGSTQEGYGVAMFDFAETGAAILNLTLEGTLPGNYSGAYAAPFVLAVESPLGLVMDNCHFRGGVTNYYHAAGLVGFASAGMDAEEVPSVTLANCSVRGEIVSTWVYTAGGLVAKGTGVQAFECSVEGYVRALATVGGIVGEAYGCNVEHCSFSGRIDGGPRDGSAVMPMRDTLGSGGLVGSASSSVSRACSADADNAWTFLPTGSLPYDFTAVGGAAGLTLGDSAFYDCAATGSIDSRSGRGGGFVGWTAGSETFSNCTTSVSLNPDKPWDCGAGNGGFAWSVASSGALFADCATSSRGNDIAGGFFVEMRPRKSGSTEFPVGSNTFRRCHVVDPIAKTAGFCSYAWNCTFEGCTVRGGMAGTGFVGSVGRRPDDSDSSTYTYEQTNTFAAVTPYSDYSTDYFEDCYRPEESPIGDCNNADAEGVEVLTAAQFASATAVYAIGERYGELPVPVWAGHAFLGWFDAAQGDTQVTAESRVTSRPARMLYAHWTDRQTVTFDPNGGHCDTEKDGGG